MNLLLVCKAKESSHTLLCRWPLPCLNCLHLLHVWLNSIAGMSLIVQTHFSPHLHKACCPQDSSQYLEFLCMIFHGLRIHQVVINVDHDNIIHLLLENGITKGCEC
jgi:hypothetical protein